jgi:hypothetical protein
MRVVKAERWHKVAGASEGLFRGAGVAPRRCSVCGSADLAAPGETVVDGASLARYRVVRCGGCDYDLLELVPAVVAKAC